MSAHTAAGDTAVPPYTALASVYDLVMDHIDYEEWALYIRDIVREFAREPETVLELGCGTASFALEFAEMIGAHYLATDASPSMIRVAREKATMFGAAIDLDVADFRSIEVDRTYDLVLLLYDGINYLLTPRAVETALACIRNTLAPNGYLIFDQSTPANSMNNASFFEDSGEEGSASYVRQSRFDVQTGLHHTSFQMIIEGESYTEHHVQRAYTLETMKGCVTRAGFDLVAMLEDFTTEQATSDSERVQWVLRST